MAPAPNVLDVVRSSCQRVVKLTQDVSIDQEALQQFAASLDAPLVSACAHGLQLPIKFESKEAEISFLALYHMLDFGTGYNKDLERRYKRDQKEVLQYGMMGVHMSAKKLDTQWMTSFNAGTVTAQFGIDPHEDQAVPNLPGVTMSRAGSLAPLVNSLAQAVREAGSALDEEGASSLGQAILSVVDSLAKKKSETPAASLVSELVDALPAYSDQGLYEGEKVVFARKAQALVFDLYNRFHKSDPRFNFADVSLLTGDSGATTIAVLRAKGVIKLGYEVASTVDEGKDIAPGPQERAMRAAAVCAIDALVTALGPGATSSHVSAYLNFLAEPGQALHGQIHRHCTRNTLAY